MKNKQNLLTLLFVLLLGIVLCFSSQFVWKNKPQTQQPVASSNLCIGANDAAASVPACETLYPSVQRSGFPIAYKSVDTSSYTGSICNGAACGTYNAGSNKKVSYGLVDFIVSSLPWSVFAGIILLIARKSIKR